VGLEIYPTSLVWKSAKLMARSAAVKSVAYRQINARYWGLNGVCWMMASPGQKKFSLAKGMRMVCVSQGLGSSFAAALLMTDPMAR